MDSFDFEVDFFGARYNGNLNCFIDWTVYFYGAYEHEILCLFRDIVSGIKEPVFFDVGANIGHHSLFMAKHCTHVHAFEPYAAVAEKLEQKIAKNNISNIVVHQVGLGLKNEKLPYFAPKDNNTGKGSFIPSHDFGITEYGKLRIVDADEYIANLKLEKIDLIKIDVCGYEKNVLNGLVNSMAKYRPVIVMEFSHTTKDSFSDVGALEALFPAGYRIKRISSNRPRWLLFNSPKYKLADFDFNGTGGRIAAIPNDAVLSRIGSS